MSGRAKLTDTSGESICGAGIENRAVAIFENDTGPAILRYRCPWGVHSRGSGSDFFETTQAVAVRLLKGLCQEV